MTFSIDTLIDDVLIELILILPVHDVLNIRKTCKRLSFLTRIRTVWSTKFRVEVVQRKLPIPGNYLPFRDLPTNDLEWRTLRAIQLEHKWERRSRQTALTTYLPVSNSAQQVILLPGGQNALTVHSNCITSWRVGLPSLSENAAVENLHTWTWPSTIARAVRDNGRSDCIAIEMNNELERSIAVLSVNVDGAFSVLGTCLISPTEQLVGIFDDFILLDDNRESEHNGKVAIKHWKLNYEVLLETPPQGGNYLTHTVFNHRLVVLWERAIALYPIPSATFPSADQRGCRLDFVQAFYLHQPVQLPASMSSCRPHSLPDPSYLEHGTEDDLSCLSVISSKAVVHNWGPGHNFERSVLHPVNNSNKKFALSTVPMPVDTEECSGICLGPSGRGVWNDSGNISLCTPRTIITRLGKMQIVDFDDHCRPLCRIPAGDTGPVCLDFDDGMGRIAVVYSQGVKIIDLV